MRPRRYSVLMTKNCEQSQQPGGAYKRTREVTAAISGYRRFLIKLVCLRVLGNLYRAVLIFLEFQRLLDEPPGSIASCHPSGWIQAELYAKSMLKSETNKRRMDNTSICWIYTVCPGCVRTYFFKFCPALPSVGELWTQYIIMELGILSFELVWRTNCVLVPQLNAQVVLWPSINKLQNTCMRIPQVSRTKC